MSDWKITEHRIPQRECERVTPMPKNDAGWEYCQDEISRAIRAAIDDCCHPCGWEWSKADERYECIECGAVSTNMRGKNPGPHRVSGR